MVRFQAKPCSMFRRRPDSLRLGWLRQSSAFVEIQAGLMELTQPTGIRACSIAVRILRATHEGLPVAFIGSLDYDAAAHGAGQSHLRLQ